LGQEFGLPGLSWTRWLALEESANRLAKAGARWIDIGLCNGKPFLLWAGIGLDAFIVHRIRQREHWVKNFAVAQYLTTTLASANIWPGFNIKITINENEITGHFLVAVVSNIRLYAGGIARLSPEARLDDGVMELFLFKGETLRDTVQHIWDLYTGHHLQSDQVLHYEFQSLLLESDSKMFVQIDGDPVDRSAVLGIEVRSKALKVLVPDPIPHILFV
jgi:diacylglycerol kinase family enzyme